MSTTHLDDEAQLLRLLADSIDEVFWIADPQVERTFYVSPAYERLWRASREELYRNPRSFMAPIHPDDRDRVADALLVQKQAKPFEHEYRLLHADGAVRWILDRGIPVHDAAGRVRSYAGVAQDITKRKLAELELQASEEQLRTIHDHAPIGLAVNDLDGRFLEVNQALCRITGYAREELLAMRFQDITHPDDVAADVANLQRLIAGEISSFQMEKRYFRKSGEIAWVQLHAALMHDRQGRPTCGIGQILDITEHKRALDELQQSRRRLQRLAEHREQIRESERKRIAREVHDELGQILTALRMGLSLIKIKHGELPALQPDLARLAAIAEQGIAVVRNIATSLRPAALDLGLVPALQWQQRNFADSTGLICHLDCDALMCQPGEAQAAAVFRIVQESLTNVARHAQAQQVWVRVASAERLLSIDIADDGQGFDPAALEGQGLGLAGIFERVEALGGAAAIDGHGPRGGAALHCSIQITPDEKSP